MRTWVLAEPAYEAQNTVIDIQLKPETVHVAALSVPPPLSGLMRFFRCSVPCISLLATACSPAGGQSPAIPDVQSPKRVAVVPASSPVVVELFQSQGCSSCPPANANVNALANRPDVLPLSFGVTYWDQLGWTDSFARPEYTARQWDYARSAGRGNVATPQVVINGGTQTIVGSNPGQLNAAIAAAGAPRGGPAIRSDGGRIQLGAGPGKPSTVWLVRYDPRVRQVAIRAGENGGRTLPHRGVVRQMVRLGQWTGAPAQFGLPDPSEPGLLGAVLVQQGLGGPITAARRI